MHNYFNIYILRVYVGIMTKPRTRALCIAPQWLGVQTENIVEFVI